MIELLILYKLCKQIGYTASEKGRRAIAYQLMLLLFWFGGEFCAAVIAIIALVLCYGERFEEYWVLGYIAAIAGGALGAWIAFTIVAKLPEQATDEAL